ncbi:MAG: hypothetical protein N3F08_05400 [Crenarchaeota archaeon]|nr:hypothetical protein [Thermoproteota archaeon]
MRLVLVIMVLTLIALSPVLLVDSILALLPSSSIRYNGESINLSGLNNGPWVYALGMSISGFSVEAVATQGKNLVSVFTQFFNSGVWLIICLAIILIISIVASILSRSVSDAVKASVLSLATVSVLGVYFLHKDLKPFLYGLSLRSVVVDDAVATLSLVIITGTVVNIIAVAVLSGVLTHLVLTLKPPPAPSKPTPPQALEKPVETGIGGARRGKIPPLGTPPLCPSCGSKLVWKPEESKYYCEKCQVYPEEVYLSI